VKKEVGLWIDHRQAVIVSLLDQGEEIKRISSGMGKHIRYSGASQSKNAVGSHDDAGEDTRDRRFGNDLSEYYDRVISSLRDADSILIIGPGEAKGELQKRLEGEALGGRVVAVETADKMTAGQIGAAVRQHFKNRVS
jgi:stalled ribosome rescue protein Dom34